MHNHESRKISRSSPLPVYQQISNDLLARITQDEWSLGGKLPSEHELSVKYGASRVTIRQALAKLEADGLIDKQRGRGAFLKANPSLAVQELYLPQPGVEYVSSNTPVDTKITVVAQASAEVYDRLDLPIGSKLIHVERSYLRQGNLVGINRAWLPCKLVPDMAEHQLVHDSISKTLQERYHMHYESVENYIEAIMLSVTSAAQLDTISPSPALKISSLYKLKDATPIEYSITIWNGRNTQFRVMISDEAPSQNEME